MGLPGFAVFESKEPVTRIELHVTPNANQAKARIFGITAERDLWFEADKPLSAYAKEAGRLERINA